MSRIAWKEACRQAIKMLMIQMRTKMRMKLRLSMASLNKRECRIESHYRR